MSHVITHAYINMDGDRWMQDMIIGYDVFLK